MDSNDGEDDQDYETKTITPSEDIDVAHDVDMLRMERMDDDSIYVAGYTDGDDEPDYRYWFICTDDGLRIDSEKHPEGM
ncbi:hypothetical protein JMJ58_03760 [Haloterrigena salifodinae]|uniref:Uncharacterized protein n=1 Tax=Haloterrigena salifodinae TaxID=2675099 RepID=A0A8T8E2D9_9EURY|nr:hypothetical protein [Haloterrigena salifodinae]QRV16025.1 hypothetical protein JMJ58_03760 [Haloterrigena salifodinae]